MQHTSRSVYEHISAQTNDPIVEWKICAISGTEFPIYQSDIEFYNKISPTFAGQKFQIPTPTLCPEERSRRRLSFRNERKLYKRKCDFSGKDIISIYSPNKPYKVYDQTVWWSDARDPMDYGFEFDFTKTFTENFAELYHKIPLISLRNLSPQNAEYNNNCFSLKDSYMNFNSDYGENIHYSYVTEHCENIIDCSYTHNSQYCYGSTDTQKCYHCFYCINILESSYCYYSSDLIGCRYCYGCFGIRGSEYMWNNKQKTAQERMNLWNQTQKRQIGTGSGISHNIITNSDGSNGNYISNSKNAIQSFDINEGENLKHIIYAPFGVNNTYDSYALGMIEWGYECNEGGINISHCCFVKHPMEGLYKSLYCILCGHSSSNLFGCIGLRNKQYCIFNRQYTKEEYEIQVAKIIQHMISTGERGEYFHLSLSPFGYNETVAQEYFPLDKQEVLARGYARSNYSSDPVIPIGTTTLTGNQIPSDINTVTDDILKQVLICEASGRPYMIQKAELEFYRKHNLPIPRKHPDMRHEERMKLRPGRTLYLRTCDCCGKEMLSVYAEKEEKVTNAEKGERETSLASGASSTSSASSIYCEECYQKEIYS